MGQSAVMLYEAVGRVRTYKFVANFQFVDNYISLYLYTFTRYVDCSTTVNAKCLAKLTSSHARPPHKTLSLNAREKTSAAEAGLLQANTEEAVAAEKRRCSLAVSIK